MVFNTTLLILIITWFLFQLDRLYGGYDNTQNPSEIAACAMRVFSLKYHPEKDNIFVTGGLSSFMEIFIRSIDCLNFCCLTSRSKYFMHNQMRIISKLYET
jgi:hypothetical protein